MARTARAPDAGRGLIDSLNVTPPPPCAGWGCLSRAGVSRDRTSPVPITGSSAKRFNYSTSTLVFQIGWLPSSPTRGRPDVVATASGLGLLNASQHVVPEDLNNEAKICFWRELRSSLRSQRSSRINRRRRRAAPAARNEVPRCGDPSCHGG